ncbi:uncharacterized protein LODBEIA_P26840 [Lodderomyces beijingensis]|uniref:Uncharacterized protein n=1 Tax=Lodderomyces beijingensis TaxID=1775926 RepID=A0ABP0ZQH8_9ASCO
MTVSSQGQETFYKLFTYTVILLPTLTSILFPINSSSVPRNEQIGNFIIDLLTVVLISWVVRFTIEWPYNWMKQLQATKTSLLKQLKSENRENHDKIIMLVRKIYTFEIIALLCCLLSSIFSSTLLIWTRKYTIIDQKRKKMVFNNVNIALLQFWSIFRIIITFTDSLQNSSFSNGQVHMPDSNLQHWLQDLKHYFLPNLANQILLDHLQSHNREFDRMKLDLARVQRELEERNFQATYNSPIEVHRHRNNQKQLSSSPNYKDARKLENYEHPCHESSSTISPFPLSLSPKDGAISPSQTQFDYSSAAQALPPPLQHQQQPPLLPKRRSSLTMGKSPLKTIIEEDDLVFESLEAPSFSRFDESTEVIHRKSFSENVESALRSIKQELTLYDIYNNPKSVRKILVGELTPLVNQLQFQDYEILKAFLMEVLDKYLLAIYVHVMEQVADIISHPMHHLFALVTLAIWTIPLYTIKFYFRLLVAIPQAIIRWTIIQPAFLAYLIAFAIISLPFKGSRIKLVQARPRENSSASPVPRSNTPTTKENNTLLMNKLMIENSPTLNNQFTMKQFHLSPTLSKEEHFNSTFPIQAQHGTRKYRSAPLISVTPNAVKTNRLPRNLRYERTTSSLYDD